jgi:hypothetical protein
MVPVNAQLHDLPEDQIASFVKSQCITRNIPPQNFFFDAGMRTSLVSRFGIIWSPLTNPIDCGGRPSERMVSAKIQTPCREYYSKFITELWYGVRLIVEAGQFRGMKESVMQEFCQREWTTVGNNKIEVESKSDMKDKLGKSPDLADAVAIGCEGARRLGFITDTPLNKEFKQEDSRWKSKLKERAKTMWQSGQLSYS